MARGQEGRVGRQQACNWAVPALDCASGKLAALCSQYNRTRKPRARTPAAGATTKCMPRRPRRPLTSSWQ